jgi:small subunit ribosomal protein S4
VARYTESQCRICRREGDKLFLKGDRCFSEKCAFTRRGYAPGQHGQMRRKPTPYCVQLREKQKVRRMYGMLESQFRIFFERASRIKGATGENLLRLLECRLDNIAYRAGFAANRGDARQLVRHGHVRVNGKRVSIPSYQVRIGDVVHVDPKSVGLKRVLEAVTQAERRPALRWIECDRQQMKASITSFPGREDFDPNLRDELVVELYSK